MAAVSLIGRGTVVRGNVRGDGSLEIQGRVEGDVSVTGDVVLGEEAVVRGNINGAQLNIAGTVQGDLRGSESLLVERGARVVGDLTSPRIGVAPGALVRGNVRTDGEAPLATPAARRPGLTSQPLRGAVPAARPAPAAIPKLEPVKAAPPPPPPSPPKVEEEETPEPEELESEPPKAPAAKAPPPVVPALGKHAKAKKKRRDA